MLEKTMPEEKTEELRSVKAILTELENGIKNHRSQHQNG